MRTIRPNRALFTTAALALTLAASVQQAQAVNSFDLATKLFGVHVLQVIGSTTVDVTGQAPSLAGGTYRLTMDPGATIQVSGGSLATSTPVAINEIFGFYQVYDAEFYAGTGLLSGAQVPTTSNTAGWSNDQEVSLNPEDGPGGSAVGFATSPSGGNALVPPVSGTNTKGDFTFGQTILASGQPTGVYWGFDVRTVSSSGLTGKVYIDVGGGRTIIPEPAFYQLASLIGLGGFGLFRLRRSKKA